MNDELFERLNNLNTDVVNMQGLAIMGFTHIERIQKLVIYEDIKRIKLECEEYSKKLKSAISELEKDS